MKDNALYVGREIVFFAHRTVLESQELMIGSRHQNRNVCYVGNIQTKPTKTNEPAKISKMKLRNFKPETRSRLKLRGALGTPKGQLGLNTIV